MFDDLDIHKDDKQYTDDYRAYVWQKFCIARQYKITKIIEIGVRCGYSAFGFLESSPQAFYYGFDAENGSHGGGDHSYTEFAKKQLKKFPNFKYIKEIDTQTILSLGDIKADFIHIDGDHTKQGVIHDLELVYKNHFEKNGIILVDDIYRIPEVRDGVKQFLKNHPKLKYKYIESFNGDVIIGNIAELNSVHYFLEQRQSYLKKDIKQIIEKKDINQIKEKKIKKEIEIYLNDKTKSCLISDFRNKKIVDYCRPGNKILIAFIHGLGDAIMFLPVFEKLKKEFPETQIDIFLDNGQEQIFDSVPPDTKLSTYDYAFYIKFSMSENMTQNITKQNLCCQQEIGISTFKEPSLKILPSLKNPLVAVHYNGTCIPEFTNCKYNVAKEIWQEIKDMNMIPIEVHFLHAYHNPINEKYDFIDNSIRNYPANLKTLFGVIQNCQAFIGVASGPLCVASSYMPNKTLYLQNKFDISNYFNIDYIKIEEYQKGDIKKWLSKI